jgi:hypothetical protein
MGLDGVEIVMLAEERFGIVIDDDEAALITTPRMLIDLVVSKTANAGTRACKTHRAFAIARRTLIEHAGAKRGDVKPATTLCLLVQPEKHPLVWNALKESLGSAKWPALEWPLAHAVSLWAMAISFLALFLTATAFAFPLSTAFLASAAAAILLATAANRLVQPLANSIPTRIKTVGDLAQTVAATLKDGQWTRGEIAHGVRSIIMEVLAPPADKYYEDAQLVKDLGLS